MVVGSAVDDLGAAPPVTSGPTPRERQTASGRTNGATRTSVTDDAISSIRQMILTGELTPGDRLPPEADLAAHLGLSRTSLREAVRALTFLGAIDTRQGDGTYVTGLGPELLLGALGMAADLQREDGLADLIGVRRILEPAATAMAATRITEQDLDLLRSSTAAGMSAQPAARLVEADLDFHRTIARASGNTILGALLDGLAAPTVRIRVWRGLSTQGSVERTLVEHRAIVAALQARDPELARAAATVHVAGVESWVRSLAPGWSARAAREVAGTGTPQDRESRDGHAVNGDAVDGHPVDGVGRGTDEGD